VSTHTDSPVVFLGAGPAGLTGAYEVGKAGLLPLVFEADPRYVGGISRTVEFKGYRFDIGGHRFFSKSQEIEDLWREILPDDFIERPRKSRIYYGGKFYSYPLRPWEAFTNLGPIESFRCGLSYLWARLFPKRNPVSFEDFVVNLFGRRLFETFFKTYTEKVWGMKCSEISADWAAQRIKGLSLAKAVLSALRPKGASQGGETIKTLINSFRYPRLGPGMMWEECTRKITQRGGEVVMDSRVVGVSFDAATDKWTVRTKSGAGEVSEVRCKDVVSTLPIRELINLLEPPVSPACLHAANQLRYRDFITVAVILQDRELWDDQWIYIHEPNVKVGRIQNFKSWSPELVPDPKTTCLGMEYFCFEGDGLWTSSDEDLIALGVSELLTLGLAKKEDVVDACVIRQKKAYPVYDQEYQGHVEVIRKEIAERYPRLHLVGRNGMHKYNNQDHSMMTALCVARNIVAGHQIVDPWLVNEDAEYHEEESKSTSGLRDVPRKI